MAYSQLEDRVILGDRLLNRQVESDDELQSLQTELNQWSSFNNDLLRSIIEDDSFYREYQRPQSRAIARRPTLQEKTGYLRSSLSNFQSRLRTIQSKLSLYQVSPEADVFSPVQVAPGQIGGGISDTISTGIGPPIAVSHQGTVAIGDRDSSKTDATVQLDALIMKGGGVKGIAIAGAIQELDAFYSFDSFVGTSAGAIAALLLASGYNGTELATILKEKDFREFLDANPLFVLPNLIIRHGMHDGKAIQNWLQNLVWDKLGKGTDIKLNELPKRAVMYVASAGRGAVTFDSRGERGERSAVFAARCSMSIPLLFQPQQDDGRHSYDGGLFNNFPLETFLGEEKASNRNPSFVAIYLGSVKPKPFTSRSLIAELIGLYMDRNDLDIVDKNIEHTLAIETDPIGTIDFALTNDEKSLLFNQGRKAALLFVDRNQAIPKELKRGLASRLASISTETERLRMIVVARRAKLRWWRIFMSIAIAVGLVALKCHVWLLHGTK